MFKTGLKKKINDGTLTIGSWITLSDPGIADIMAKAGFDWLTIDLEHSATSINQAANLIRAVEFYGVAPLIRLTSNDENQIKRVMDAGAHGVIVPNVKSVEEAKKAVRAVYYPPTGERGVGLARAQEYGVSFDTYKEWLSEEAVIIVQIEHIAAVNDLEAILSVDGVDGFIVGPYDLTGSLGNPGAFDDPAFLDAMETIKTVSKKLNKTGGVHVVEPNQAQLQARIDEGYRFLAYSVDIRMLDTVCRSGLKGLK